MTIEVQEDLIHVCPFCYSIHGDEPFECCGEFGHGITMTQEQYDFLETPEETK